MTNTRTWASVNEVKEANSLLGHHWFSPSTMRFFKSRIITGILYDRYFITSEKACFEDETRVFKVRIANDNGSVDTVDGQQDGFSSKAKALKFLNKLVEVVA